MNDHIRTTTTVMRTKDAIRMIIDAHPRHTVADRVSQDLARHALSAATVLSEKYSMCGEIDGGTTSFSKTHRVEKSSVIRKQHSAEDSTSASVGSHSASLVTVLNSRIARFSRTMNPLMVALMLKCTTSTNMSVNPPWRTSKTSASPYANSAQSPPTKTQSARLTSFLHGRSRTSTNDFLHARRLMAKQVECKLSTFLPQSCESS